MDLTIGFLALAVSAAPTQQEKPGRSPIGVVRAFYRAADEGRCADVLQHFAAESVEVANRMLGGPDGLARFCASHAGGSPLESLQVKGAQITGGKAEVTTERRFADGARAVETHHLVKRDGIWLILLREEDLSESKAP